MTDEEKPREELREEIRALRARLAQVEGKAANQELFLAQAEATGSQLDYWKMFENIPVGIYRTTPDDKIVKANQAMADMLGYPRVSDLLQVYVSSLYVDIEDRFSHLQVLIQQPTFFAEFRLRRKDGGVIWVRDYPRALRDADGEIAFFDGVLTDITERKKIEELLYSHVVIP